MWTYWYLEQVELVTDGADGWKVTGGLCWAVIRKPTASRLKLTHVPVQRITTHDTQGRTAGVLRCGRTKGLRD